MKKIYYICILIMLVVVLAACDDEITLNGHYQASATNYSIDMDFDAPSKLVTLENDGKKMTSQYKIELDQLILDHRPTYQIVKIGDEQYELYKITDEGVSPKMAYTLSKK
ncbi:hypothetical protein [Kurthia sibirica]|uniref:Uncharacterized protein n=1 Tax=Kurthia sibirica TaxID=202750 RepID=A0A2U3AML8_9BACL|nr:hypothetical protein [Kurthia sibirica]PWI25761.1 hypothetical protein DEX24_06045 [Kurthia sibirica]GEK35455.1 hypothetical protein KSI01_29880 [Kurthia sibirica]